MRNGYRWLKRNKEVAYMSQNCRRRHHLSLQQPRGWKNKVNNHDQIVRRLDTKRKLSPLISYLFFTAGLHDFCEGVFDFGVAFERTVENK